MQFNTPQEVLDALVHAYFEERNIEVVLSCVTDDVEWIGTEDNDSASGKPALEELLKLDMEHYPAPFGVEIQQPTVQIANQDVVLFAVVGMQKNIPGIANGLTVRGSVCCVNMENGWLVNHVHTSVPSKDKEKQILEREKEIQSKKDLDRFYLVIDEMHAAVFEWDLKEGSFYHSAAYEQYAMSQVSIEDILNNKGTLDTVHPEDIDILKQFFVDSNGSKDKAECTLRVKLITGEYRWCRMIGLFYKDENSVPTHIIGIILDVDSEHANSVKMSNLLNTVPAGIGIVDIDANGIKQSYLNDAFYEQIGAKREDRKEYFGSRALGSTHPDDMSKMKDGIQRLLTGDNSTQLDYRVKGRQGKWYWLHLSAIVVERHENSVKLHVSYTECTESKRRELQLLHNQKAVTLAEEEGHLTIWTYNMDKGIIEQQMLVDKDGQSGYPAYISNVPQCFVESGNVHPEDIEKFLLAYDKLNAGEEKVNELYRIKDQNTGKFNWVRMYYQRTDSNDDGDRIAVGFSLEVNKQQEAIERYQTEEKLREQMYTSAMIYLEYNLTKCGYVGKNNLDERYRHGTWECATIEEYRENMSQNVEASYLNEVTEKMFARNLLKAFERGETRVFCEYRSKERLGKPSFWCRITAVMVKRPDTGDVMAFVYVEDIERVKDRQLAIESSMSDGIENVAIIHLADGQTRIIMESGIRLQAKTEKQIVYNDDFVRKAHGAVIEESVEFGDEAALLSTVISELEKRDVYQYSITTKRNGDEEKRQLIRFRYLDDRKTKIVMSVSNITSLYLEEQQQKRQLEEALSKAQNASHAKADFYSRMSHDMRTPMNGILGMANLSENETDSAKLKENIGKIKESGEYLLSLINDTLDIQRIESGKMKLEPTIVNTMNVVRNITEMISVTAKAKGVELKYNKGNADLNWYIRADALRLKQIFINLLSNAVKFTLAGGTVEFEFKLLFREGMISHDVVYVRDTGVGMSKEFLETGIFKPFSQERNTVSGNYAGSGLGLSIAKSLVEMMGGHIEVESELGVGTTFAVYLDFERVSEEEVKATLQSKKEQSKDVSKQLKGRKILLAEDHLLNAEIARKLLEKAGCEVIWAKNGQESVSVFADAPVNAFDVILMDIRMPVMDGLEAARQIRALEKADATSIPIIAMTANAYEEDVKASLDAGMNAHLGKPIEPSTMYETIASAIIKEKNQ